MNKVLLNLSVILAAIALKYKLTGKLQDNVLNSDIYFILLIGTEAAFFQMVSYLMMGIMASDTRSALTIAAVHGAIIYGIYAYSMWEKKRNNIEKAGQYFGEEYFNRKGISSWIIKDDRNIMCLTFACDRNSDYLCFDEHDELMAICSDLGYGNGTYGLEIINREKASSLLRTIGIDEYESALTVAYHKDTESIELTNDTGIILRIRLSERKGKRTCTIQSRQE